MEKACVGLFVCLEVYNVQNINSTVYWLSRRFSFVKRAVIGKVTECLSIHSMNRPAQVQIPVLASKFTLKMEIYNFA